MFEKLKSVLRITPSKTKGITWQNDERPGCSTSHPFLGCTLSDSYDNAFPDIARIAEAFAEVMPFAVDEKGRRLAKQPQIIKALYNPNKEMSISDFLETLITMLLVHPLVHILVWHYENGKLVPGGPLTPDNVAGFTFLEDTFVSRLNGEITFRKGDKTWTRQDVITLSLNVNPYQLMMGYSPTQAIKKWATVDDYIAEYQASQFGNGGVPAGLMTVTAPSVDAYNEAVDKLIAAHTGPSNANRIVYTHRPTSTIDGKPMAAGVEWTPFAQTNKELTLDALFNQANKKIDMNFGVPEEVKGYLQNSNYASAEVADYVFARRILYPKLVKVYSKFTHEMNRVTGGMGFAFSFDYDLPVLTDTRKVQTDTLVEMLNAGFTVESAVEALRLPRSFLKLVRSTETNDENLQVEDTTSEKPSQNEVSKSAHECTHEHCHHEKSEINWEGVINPTLKGLISTYLTLLQNQVASSSISDVKNRLNNDESVARIIELIKADIFYQMSLNEIESANRFANRLNTESASTLNDEQLRDFNMQIQSLAAQARTLVDSRQSLDALNLGAIGTVMALFTSTLAEYGIRGTIPDFADGDTYNEQLDFLLRQFGERQLDLWQTALELETSTTSEQAMDVIRQVISENDWQINRWALTEQHRGEELGELLAAEEAGDVAKLEPYKVWQNRPGACDRCVKLNNERVRADLPFSNGDMVPAEHPNCRCYFEIVFLPLQKSVKVTCPHCKRYMFESNGGIMKNVICANSKCKRHYDIEVKNGKISAKEVKV